MNTGGRWPSPVLAFVLEFRIPDSDAPPVWEADTDAELQIGSPVCEAMEGHVQPFGLRLHIAGVIREGRPQVELECGIRDRFAPLGRVGDASSDVATGDARCPKGPHGLL